MPKDYRRQWQEQPGFKWRTLFHCINAGLLSCLLDLLEFCFPSWCKMKSSTYIQSTTSLIISTTQLCSPSFQLRDSFRPSRNRVCKTISKYQGIIQTITKQWLFALIDKGCSLHIYKACFLWKTKKSQHTRRKQSKENNNSWQKQSVFFPVKPPVLTFLLLQKVPPQTAIKTGVSRP